MIQSFDQFVCTTCAMVFKVECRVGTRALLCSLRYGIISRPAANRHCVPNIVCLMTTLFPITESVFESILCWTNHAFACIFGDLLRPWLILARSLALQIVAPSLALQKGQCLRQFHIQPEVT